MWPGALIAALAFLSGAVPYGMLLARLRGVDLRQVGSGNIGATNAARALGKKLGLVVLLLDVAKGFGPALAARFVLGMGSSPAADGWIAGAMLAAVLGHVFTPLLAFRGGKGVATGFGVILAASPWAGLAGAAVFAGLYAAFRISSLGSLGGTLVAPVVMYLLGTPVPECGATLAVGLLIVAKHHENIRRLLRREEGKV